MADSPEVIEARERLAVENALKNKETSFVVDQATDEQLMMAELKSKYPSSFSLKIV